MYCQITTYCNMSCAHCCFSCEKGKKGEHMARSTFNKVLSFAEQFGDYFSIGGGEPTMHPKFWDFFGMSMASNCEGIWLATNGSITKTAIALAELSSEGKFSCALSQDSYHAPIDYAVIKKFKNCGLEIRNNDAHISKTGAAIKNNIWTHTDCACQCIHVKPNGDMYACGCDNSLRIGNIENIDKDVYTRANEMLDEEGCGTHFKQDAINYIFNGTREKNES